MYTPQSTHIVLAAIFQGSIEYNIVWCDNLMCSWTRQPWH